ncbi:hypothetical protein DICSQDRAFT_173520 [Dichomitus squalens LYAD-421 SS1]|uniref:Heterokaryon incompatibility domain-containing protein n=1 Tax=Dichomitus squalens (strain LYAD-421) TaxID=732165 RepID=R7SPN0_DICSQ|nr:uncharacterized protein DICSQDRAFT_173520 [Dichomitus squalens LYAD-421 SS1]EJF57898.1 hypothetical protein DICSQDRAFT_173520 [Dichomitus squalens LYAD-421 SS1]
MLQFLFLVFTPISRLILLVVNQLRLHPSAATSLEPVTSRLLIPEAVDAPVENSSPPLPAEPISENRAQTALPPIWDDPQLSPKIKMACAVAREAGFRYIWIDSCCIDKVSSSELSEAINSMYAWYGDADICHTYLADVPPGDAPHSEDSSFRESRWFRRGWTLQELIAPAELMII